jgi:minor histocompatibility antigen H13
MAAAATFKFLIAALVCAIFLLGLVLPITLASDTNNGPTAVEAEVTSSGDAALMGDVLDILKSVEVDSSTNSSSEVIIEKSSESLNGTSSSANSSSVSKLSSKMQTVKATLQRIATSMSKENMKIFCSYSKESVLNATFTKEEAVPPVLFFSSMFSYVTFACSRGMTKYGLYIAYLGLILISGASYFVDIPVYMNLIASSIFIILIGCQKSLRLLLSDTSELNSIERSFKGISPKGNDVLSSEDAYWFPVRASCSLFGLYLAFQNFKPETINLIISTYMAIVGIYALHVTFSPFFSWIMGSAKDEYEKQTYFIDYKFDKDSFMGELEIKLTLADLLSIVTGGIISFFYFKTKHFLLSNVIGISFCISAISSMSLGSYKTGLFLLVGLFFYDIFWVFGTDVMISVAKNLDAPIKLLFPTSVLDKASNEMVRKFSLLGLGDIVIPGFFISILLRFDALRALHFQVLRDFINRITVHEANKKIDDQNFKLLDHFNRYKHQDLSAPTACLNSRTFQFAISELGLKPDISEAEWNAVDSKFNLKHDGANCIDFEKFVKYAETQKKHSLEEKLQSMKDVEHVYFYRPYFQWTLIGYLFGLALTVAVMFVFKAGQPALLYLVPACLIFSLTVAFFRSELTELLEYSEETKEIKKTQKVDVDLNPKPNPTYLLSSYVALLVVWGSSYFIGKNITFRGETYFLDIPVPCNLIVISSLIIYIGCHKSLNLLVSEADGGAKSKNKDVLSFDDAKMFPIVGSCTLFGLYCAIKYFGSDIVNILFSVYFAFVGTFSLTNMIYPLISVFIKSEQPLFDKKKVNFWVVGEIDVLITAAGIVSGLIACVLGYFYFTTKHFLLSNMYGVSFCVQSIESISLGSYKTGAMLLVGLFFYDIFWVFRTDVMVTVAKNIDAPIKLLFPYVVDTATDASKIDIQLSFEGLKEFSKLLMPRLILTGVHTVHETQFSLLGLGDIVIPGFFIAVLLRFDAVRSKIHSKAIAANMGSFEKPYFHYNLFGYILGLAVTVAVMFFFKAAQPALLYLVPACLFTSLIVAFCRLEMTQLLLYHEELKEPTDMNSYEPIEFATDPVTAGLEEGSLIDFIDGWVTPKDLFPCAAVSITREGRETFFYSTGYSDVEGDMLNQLDPNRGTTKKPVPLAKDTIHRIYSMTKPITSIAIMILVDQKKIKLDDDLYTFIPEFKDMEIITGGDKSKPVRTPAKNHIKIRDLLNHSSGIAYGLRPNSICDELVKSALDSDKKDAGNYYANLSLEELCVRLAKAPLMFEPGTRWYYGLNTDVLARVIEVVSKTSFSDFIKRRILEPIGMVDTDFYVPDHKRERLSKCYYKSPTDLSFKPCLPDIQNKSKPDALESGGGGLLSTIDDYNKFINCLLSDTCYKSSSGNENRLISQDLFQQMITNQLPKIDGKESDIHTCHFSNPSADGPMLISNRGFAESLGPGVGFGFGFSIIIDPVAAKCRNKGEYGWGGIASTFFSVDPVAKTSCLLMTQLSPSDAYPIRSQLRKYYYKVAHK